MTYRILMQVAVKPHLNEVSELSTFETYEEAYDFVNKMKDKLIEEVYFIGIWKGYLGVGSVWRRNDDLVWIELDIINYKGGSVNEG